MTSLYYAFLRVKQSAYAKVANIDYNIDGNNKEFYLISVVYINDGTRPVVVTCPSLQIVSPDASRACVDWKPVSVVFPFVLAANDVRIVQFKVDGILISDVLKIGEKAYSRILYQTISSTGDVFVTFSPDEIEFTGFNNGRMKSVGPKQPYWLNQKTNLLNKSLWPDNNQ